MYMYFSHLRKKRGEKETDKTCIFNHSDMRCKDRGAL